MSFETTGAVLRSMRPNPRVPFVKLSINPLSCGDSREGFGIDSAHLWIPSRNLPYFCGSLAHRGAVDESLRVFSTTLGGIDLYSSVLLPLSSVCSEYWGPGVSLVLMEDGFWVFPNENKDVCPGSNTAFVESQGSFLQDLEAFMREPLGFVTGSFPGTHAFSTKSRGFQLEQIGRSFMFPPGSTLNENLTVNFVSWWAELLGVPEQHLFDAIDRCAWVVYSDD